LDVNETHIGNMLFALIGLDTWKAIPLNSGDAIEAK
jgi:hypothetical protein